MNNLVKSSLRTLELLELFSSSSEELSLTAMSKALGIPASSMHGLIATLEHRSYIVRNPSTHKYRIGPAFIKLVNTRSIFFDLVFLAAPTLDRLAKECSEAITMSVLSESNIVFISNRASSSIIRVVNDVGTTLPAHATGSGKAMLACLTSEEIDRIYPREDLPQHTDQTISTKSELLGALARVRQQGFAYDEGESEEGVWAVASCIRGVDGEPRAAVSVVVPQVRVREDMISQWTAAVVRAAKEIGLKLAEEPDALT